MTDKVVTLQKRDFTEDDWMRLSFEFGFDPDNTVAHIRIIID